MQSLLSLLFLLPLADAPQRVSIDVVSSTAGGRVYIGVFDTADGFAREDFLVNATAELGDRRKQTRLSLELPRAGDYVFAAFQDMNGNGKLDKNMLGVPTEPYGFSETAPSKWRMPEFSEVATEVAATGQPVRVRMRRWSEY